MLTRRGEWTAGLTAVAVIIGLGWVGTLASNALVGYPETPDRQVGPQPPREGTLPVGAPTSAPVRTLPVPTRAARTRPSPAGVVAPTRAGGPDFAALARCESGGNPRAVNPSGRYFGAYQFDLSTWRSVGGTGNPADASMAEQTYRARLLYNARGGAPWPYCQRFL